MASEFMRSISRNVKRVLEETNGKCYRISAELFLSIVRLTPSPTNKGHTATGLLVNQWYPKAGGGFSSELSDSTSPSGAGSMARINSLRGGKEFFNKNGTLTLTNNVHYAYRAEKLGWPREDGWTGKVGPYAMVALSLQAIAARYR